MDCKAFSGGFSPPLSLPFSSKPSKKRESVFFSSDLDLKFLTTIRLTLTQMNPSRRHCCFSKIHDNDDEGEFESGMENLKRKYYHMLSDKERFPENSPLRLQGNGYHYEYKFESFDDDVLRIINFDTKGDPDHDLYKIRGFQDVLDELNHLASDVNATEEKKTKFLIKSVTAGVYFACLMSDESEFHPRFVWLKKGKTTFTEADKSFGMDFVTIGDILMSDIPCSELEDLMTHLIDRRIFVKFTLQLRCYFPIAFQKWVRPHEDEVTISVDGKYKVVELVDSFGIEKTVRVAGMGIVCRDSDGELLWYAYGGFDNCVSSSYVELVAIIRGMDMALRKQHRRLVVQSDCLEVCTYLKSGRSTLMRHANTASLAKDLISKFESVRVFHRVKGTNRPADFLAKKGRDVVSKMLVTTESVSIGTPLWEDGDHMTNDEKSEFQAIVNDDKKVAVARIHLVPI